MGTRDYAKKCSFSKVVIGLSGGLDSALTAVIAADVKLLRNDRVMDLRRVGQSRLPAGGRFSFGQACAGCLCPGLSARSGTPHSLHRRETVDDLGLMGGHPVFPGCPARRESAALFLVEDSALPLSGVTAVLRRGVVALDGSGRG